MIILSKTKDQPRHGREIKKIRDMDPFSYLGITLAVARHRKEKEDKEQMKNSFLSIGIISDPTAGVNMNFPGEISIKCIYFYVYILLSFSFILGVFPLAYLITGVYNVISQEIRRTHTMTYEEITAILDNHGVEYERWTKYGYDRIYINNEFDVYRKAIGLVLQYYKTGNISYAELNGEKISHAEGRRQSLAGNEWGPKCWIELSDGTVHVKNYLRNGDRLKSIIEDMLKGEE